MENLFSRVDEDSRNLSVENIKKEEDADSDMSDGVVVDEESKEALSSVKTEESESKEGKNFQRGMSEVGPRPHEGGHKKKESRSKKEIEEEEREKMQVLVSNFTEDQLDHYEMFRRSAFPKGAIKRLMQTLTGTSISQNVVIAMSGIAKVFVGEVVEEALDVMEQYGETGPLQPKHLREAVRRLRSKGCIPNCKPRRPFSRF